MTSPDSPETIARTHQVDAALVLSGRCDLRTYPYRHLAVVAHLGLPVSKTTGLLAAVEMLDQSGWELVNVTNGASNSLIGFLRRK